MIRRFTAAIFLISFCLFAGCKGEQASAQWKDAVQPWDVFAKATDEICISDGSSLYIFHPNGDFELEPLGISGRTIKGQWKLHSTMVEISGLWSWMNGTSLRDDYRTMTMNVGHIDPDFVAITSNSSGKIHKVRKAYFVIESLEKHKS